MSRKPSLRLIAVCLLVLPAFADAATYTVTNLDGWAPEPAAPAGSLGWAVYNANTNAGPDLIDFAIDPGVHGPGPWTIIADDQYTLTDAGTVIDGFTQPGASSNSIPAPGGLDAVLMISVSGEASVGLNTFGIDTDDTVIRGLNIHSGPLNDVAICFLGGVCTDNRVEGCFIGTDPTGTASLPSGWSMAWNPPYGAAVFIGGRSATNVVGSDAGDTAARNLLSGEAQMGLFNIGFGVLFLGLAGAPNDNTVQDNLIGTDPSGLLALPNGTGVAFIEGAIGNLIRNNVIGGNLGSGVAMEANATGANNANRLERNFIGISPLDDSAVPNGGAGVRLGPGSAGNLVGTGDYLMANIISGNGGDGVQMQGGNLAGCEANVVDGNIIGLDTSGASPVANAQNGVRVQSVLAANTIGQVGQGNVISGNNLSGIFLVAAQNTQIHSNLVGLNLAGDAAAPNADAGLNVGCDGLSPCSHDTLATLNLFSSNGDQGVIMVGEGTGNTLTQNQIVSNGAEGVWIRDADASNLISQNWIASNSYDGVELHGSSTELADNTIELNGGFGIYADVYYLDYGPAGAANDRLSVPTITGNTIDANDDGGIFATDCRPANAADLGVDNTIIDNNGRPDVEQRWRLAVELLDEAFTPIVAGPYTVEVQGADGTLYPADMPDGGLWGPPAFDFNDVRFWIDAIDYRIAADGTLVDGNPATIVVSGPNVGSGTFTINGIDDDGDLGGQPSGIDTGGQFRYQVAELVTEPDTDGDGVGDSVDCAPADPLYDGDTGPDCDADGDGYCDAAISGQVQSSACANECPGPLCDPSDCDDSDAAVSPAGTEGPPADPTCFDGADNDCDTATDGTDPDCQCGSDADCDDGLVCTGAESCVAGVCTAGTPIDCTGLDDQCNLGVCDEGTGGCVAQPANEGDACDDGLFCNDGETCQAGACTGGGNHDCSGLDDQCNLGVCDEGAGACQAQPANEGGACDDADACTMDETCTAGSCNGGVPTDADGDGFVAQACSGTDCDDGDAAINPDAAEVCDNGIDDDCDGATDSDDDECGPVEVCGDGTITGAEECDDNNLDDGDGCSAACAVEAGWACRTEGGLSWCGSAPGAGAVVINEIMQNSECAADATGEWFEIANFSGADLELRGWRLSDDDSDDLYIDSLALPAGGFAVLCADGDTAVNGNVTCDFVWPAYALANGADEIVLSDPADALVDRVAWDGGPLFPDPNGASMSLTAGVDATANDDGANWCEAVDPIPGGCGDLGSPGAANPACPGACPDGDSDGFTDSACGGEDCDDSDPDAYPGAPETCDDGIDQDCNGSDLTCGCADADSDGYEDDTCGGSDCDDDDGNVNPDATEICDDSIDNDCDGATDGLDSDCEPSDCGNGTLEAGEGCDDGGLDDGDGCAGDCTVEAGWACLEGSEPSLCGSTAVAGEVIITEIMQDPACADDSTGEWFEITNAAGRDLVLAGWSITDLGSDDHTIGALALPSEGIAVLCRSDDPAINGNVACDALFSGTLGNNADELFVNDPAGTLIDRVIWDAGATFPDPTGASMSLSPGMDADENDAGGNWCEASGAIPGGCGDLGSPGTANPPCGECPDADTDGFTDQLCGGTDCDDGDDAINPDAEEVCGDDIDQDCNGADLTCGCEDLDLDGYPDEACGGNDCDDGDAEVNPAADEICEDTVDNDCDGLVDDLDPDCQACADADGDGFEDQACGGTDCDDGDDAVNPDADEICDDSVDNDCDAATDDADPDCGGCPDLDGDGFEDQTCGGADCDDADTEINPDAEEVCDDSVDNDCDSEIDDADSDCAPCPDEDEDGFTSAVCGGGDCDDTDETVNPAAAEDCNNGMDDDCDGDIDEADADCGKKSSGCGCATPGRPGLAWLTLGLLIGLGWRRHR